MDTNIRTACTRHCGDGCALIATLGADGSVSLRGDPDHPFTRGRMCAKTAAFARRLASPRRIVTPLLRVGNGFREVDWEAALDVVVREIERLRPSPERMLHLMGPASFGLLFRASRLLFGKLGASGFSGAMCLAAGAAAQCCDFGTLRQGPLTSLVQSPRIVNWGCNAGIHSVHLAHLLAQARHNGTRILSIHPGDNGYAPLSDDVLVVRPGSDRFLAAAVLQRLRQRGALDATALARCHDPQAFLAVLAGLDTAALREACGIPSEAVGLVADWYGGEAATATLIGRGLQRYAYGGETVRFVDALAMLSGQVGRAGGGVYYRQGDPDAAVWDWTRTTPGFSRRLRIADLAREIERADPPVEMVWIEGLNPVTQCPDSRALERALRARFTVAVEAFMTDTARCATVILPPALMLECEDIVKSDCHPWVHYAAQVLKPRGLARSNFAIAAAVGARLQPPIVYPDPREVMDTALRTGCLRASLAELREKGWLGTPVPEVPWAHGVFDHPDGLYRLPPELHAETPAPAAFPLRLLTLARKDALHSQIPQGTQTLPPVAWVSPDSPALAGLDRRRPIRLVTPLGAMPVRLALLAGLHPEAVCVARGGWLRTGGCCNSLIEAREADMGGQIAYYAQRARLENGERPSRAAP